MVKVISLVNENGVVYASSREVAEDFGKRHDHVLESIRDIVKNLAPENSVVKYFIESYFKNRGREYPEYKLTKDGFTLLAMGFTGSEALKFKIDYMNKFNEMESQLSEIDSVMNDKGEMTEEEYATVKLSTAQRVKRTFLESQDIFKDYNRFAIYSRKTMDTKKRVKRLEQIIDTLKTREDELYRSKRKGYRAERENIIELTEIILRDINEINNRSYGQKLGWVNRKTS